MKILLINPPVWTNHKPVHLSLGMSYIYDSIKKENKDLSFLDIDSNRLSKEYVVKFLKENNFDIFCIGGLASIYSYLLWLIPVIKTLNNDSKIIIGGAIATTLREKLFKLNIDYEVIGEGEMAIRELIKAIKNNKDINKVNGIGYKRDNRIIFNPPPDPIYLDELPFVNDEIFPINDLLKNSKRGFHIHAQRGCIGKCSFCFRLYGNRLRYRNYNKVIDEIEYFNNKYLIKTFVINGECITAYRDWVINFCKEILKRKLKIRYKISSRVDTIDEEQLKWFKKSGCFTIAYGIESGSQQILDKMNKNITVKKNLSIIKLTKKYIPNIEMAIILGYLDETEETLKETVGFCKKCGVKPEFYFAFPFPGENLYIEAIDRGFIKNEEQYLSTISDIDWFDFNINLTNMSDAKNKIKNAIREINIFYRIKDIINGKIIIKLFRKFWYKSRKGIR